jgi:DNA-binding transcriptional LysR family regulator
MDLEEFRAFLAVVETGSFLAAATHLNLARATLRRRVDALEARAGVPLLERSARGVVVTEAGSLLATRGRHVLHEASALIASVREIGREPVGVLRCGLPVGLPPHALVPLFALIHATYPRLAIHLRHIDDPHSDSIDDLDLLLHFGVASPPGSWLVHEVLRMREWLLASQDYLTRRGTPHTLEELAHHDLLAWTPPGEDGRLLPLRSGDPLEVDPVLLSPDVHFLRQCALAGHGIAFIPDGMLPDPDVEPGTLVPVLPEQVGRERPLHLLVPTALASQPKLRALLGHIRGFVKDHMPHGEHSP